MKISQRNSLHSYLYLKKVKMSYFFFLYKIGEEGRTCPARK
jgi:hypothetical protein